MTSIANLSSISSLASNDSILVYDASSSDLKRVSVDNFFTYAANRGINNQTGTSYTAVSGDAEKIITLNNAAAITMTIPANSSVAYQTGTRLHFAQLGAGQVTVTITDDDLFYNSALTANLTGQYSIAHAIKIASTVWILYGDLEAA
jgi:hypothetical protein